jgi:nucleotide-binding universal stress UspA family protein
MKNILLPTDFSDNSWNAIKYAVQLFKDQKCTFHLFNAYTPIIYHVEYVLINPAQFGLGDAIRDAAKQSLNKLHKRILKQFNNNPNHKFETIARFNTLISGINELIDERHIDLVVMGTKGATGAQEVLLGSNTVQVFKEIKCPIMAIPSSFEYESPHEILFPTDLEVHYETSQFNILKEIATSHNSRLNALHVSTGYDLTVAQETNRLQLESMFESTAFLFHDVRSMEIADAINEFQVKHKINLLVMINNKHSFFENLFFKNTD